MIELPLYRGIVEEAECIGAAARREDILGALTIPFGEAAQDLAVELEAVEYDRLQELFNWALACRSLASFRKRLTS